MLEKQDLKLPLHLLTLDGKMEKAVVVNRPSKKIRSAYLADVKISSTSEEFICHSPALGCCGLIAKCATVFVQKNKNTACKSQFVLFHVWNDPLTIGTHPMIAQKLASIYLSQMYPSVTWKKEVKFGNSRFDFAAYEGDDLKMIVECKNVPLADSVDCDPAERRKRGYTSADPSDFNKIAIFPDGYRTTKEDTFSPRALKHVQELTDIHLKTGTPCLLLFVTQRSDCSSFTITKADPLYRDAVGKAKESGVLIECISIEWCSDGSTATLLKQLEVTL